MLIANGSNGLISSPVFTLYKKQKLDFLHCFQNHISFFKKQFTTRRSNPKHMWCTITSRTDASIDMERKFVTIRLIFQFQC